MRLLPVSEDLRFVVAPLLAAFAVAPAWAGPLLESLVGSGGTPPAPWHVVGLPGQTKPFTQFSVVDLDGERAVRIEADHSYGDLVQRLQPVSPASWLAWQWRVERPLERTDLSKKSGDDSEVKVCVFFDEPLGRIPFVERQLLRVLRARSSEPIPAATICYVWDSHLPVDTALDNPFTRRMRYIVLESGTARLDQWVGERRDIDADFRRVFGAECATVPPVTGVSVGADADSTRGHSLAYVSNVALEP